MTNTNKNYSFIQIDSKDIKINKIDISNNDWWY